MFGKNKEFVGQMFDEISSHYDLLNHLFTLRRDLKWRKKAVKQLFKQGVKSDLILDLATGSGDLAYEFMKLNPLKLYSVDISPGMLKINRDKLNSDKNVLIQAEAGHLPFKDKYFDITGIAFGVRNFERLSECLIEIGRVIKPGGKFITIEMFRNDTKSITLSLFNFYFRKIMRILGNLISRSSYAYDYLFNSVDSFLSVEEYTSLLSKSGFRVEYVHNNFLGIVYTVLAAKI